MKLPLTDRYSIDVEELGIALVMVGAVAYVVNLELVAAGILAVGLAVTVMGEAIEVDDSAPAAGTGSDTEPLERLRRRYAEGELDEAEFERRVERLLETEAIDEQALSDGPDRSNEPALARAERE